MGAQYLSLGLSGLGLGLNLYGQAQQAELYEQQGAWASQQGYLQAAIMDYNAAMARREAESYATLGQINQAVYLGEAAAAQGGAISAATALRRQASQTTGAQITTYLKNGVSLAGTPALVIMESQDLAERDIANVLEEGRRSSARAQAQASMALVEGLINQRKALSEAAIDRISAQEARTAGAYAASAAKQRSTAAYIGMGASLLQGIGSISMRYGSTSNSASASKSSSSGLTAFNNSASAYPYLPVG